MDEKREVEEEIKKAMLEIIEAKQNINNAIHKIIEIPVWYVDGEITADLKANVAHINYSIENIFYKINNNYNDAGKKALFEYMNPDEIQEEDLRLLIDKKFISNIKSARFENDKENSIFKIEMVFSRDEMLNYFS